MNESTPQTQAASYAVTASESWNWNESQLAELNRHLDKPFGEVELFNRCLAFALWQSGHPVEALRTEYDGDSECGWLRCVHPQWTELRHYRIAPKPEPLVLPSIDWSHVAPKWNWMAQDKEGSCCLFIHKPESGGMYQAGWLDELEGEFGDAEQFASFKPGSGDWRKLIVERPQ